VCFNGNENTTLLDVRMGRDIMEVDGDVSNTAKGVTSRLTGRKTRTGGVLTGGEEKTDGTMDETKLSLKKSS